MTGTGRKRNTRPADPSRKIVDLAQGNLSSGDFVRELLAVLEEAIGFDSAMAAHQDREENLITRHAEPEQRELAAKSLRFARTRYARDLLPVFAFSAREGACLDSQFYQSEREKRESLLYQEVLRPAGVRSMLQICARWKGQPLIRFNLNRDSGRLFQARELEAALRLLPTLEASLVAHGAGAPGVSIDGLTERESEIACFVGQGLTTPQIAEVLGTSRFTVRNQLTRIYEKLDIGGRVELAALIARHEKSQG